MIKELKQLWRLSALLLLVIGLGCTKTDKEHGLSIKKENEIKSGGGGDDGGPSTETLISYYSALGAQHNIALDTIYNNLKREADASKDPLGSVESSHVLSIVQTFATSNLSLSNIPLDSLSWNDSLLSQNHASDSSIASYAARITGTTISSALSSALTDLENIVKDSTRNTNGSVYDSLLSHLPSALTAQTTGHDLEAYIAGVETAKNSISYWNSNHGKWDSLVLEYKYGTSPPVPCYRTWQEQVMHDMAIADAAGAVTGVIHGAYLGLTVGSMVLPGIGTIVGGAVCALGGMIMGAVGGSASAGLLGAIVHYLHL